MDKRIQGKGRPALGLIAVAITCVAILGSVQSRRATWKDVKRINDRAHHWLVESGVLSCEKCGVERDLNVARLLQGP